MKINQFCSVCKKHLDMEVIPTDDGGDDGVIWLRCPECQGFLPKFTGEGLKTKTPADTAESTPQQTPVAHSPDHVDSVAPPIADDLDVVDAPDSPAAAVPSDRNLEPDSDRSKPTKPAEPAEPAEPVAEYAALLAAADTAAAKPYRPSATFEVGEVVLHLAYDDVGIVVAKETLPGGRKAVKVFFDGAGVMHLIEQDSEGH